MSCALLVAATAHAAPDIDVSAYAQPQGTWAQQEKSLAVSSPQKSGFSVAHVRATTRAIFDIGNSIQAFAQVEAEFTPTFALTDAFVAVSRVLPHGGAFTLAAGQQLTPFSRLQFTPLWKTNFAKMPDFIALTPNRQIGLSLMVAVPYLDFLELTFGAYNGEGPNNVQNIDSKLMYISRVALRFFREHQAWIGAMGTPTMGGLAKQELSVAGNFAYNDKDLGGYHELSQQASGEIFASYHGFSAYAEYYWGHTYYTSGAPKIAYHSYGFVGQAGYLVPIPGWLRDRFELTFRFDAVAPNNKVPIQAAGDPTQAHAAYTAGLNYYHKGHGIKLILNYVHNQELDDKDRLGKSISYKNDALIVQLTYRLD